MKQKIREYRGENISVQYDSHRCIHAEECVHGLPNVFRRGERPWVQPDATTAEELAGVIRKCPTGALHYESDSEDLREAMPAENWIHLAADGPNYAHANMEIYDANGNLVMKETRAAFCRCGASANKPFCDDSHVEAGFQDPGTREDVQIRTELSGQPGVLKITIRRNTSLLLEGDYRIRNADGQMIYQGNKGSLCRCGGSKNKPFCDGSHREVGFQDPLETEPSDAGESAK